jgi:hypothetical protein
MASMEKDYYIRFNFCSHFLLFHLINTFFNISQKLKTWVIKESNNLEWNKELTLSVETLLNS